MRAFGASKNSIIRSASKYRAWCVGVFYTPRATRGTSASAARSGILFDREAHSPEFFKEP